MPYIKHSDRMEYEESLEELISQLNSNGFNPGHMNYIITVMLHEAWKKNPSYSKGNDLVGVLECAKQEFYRRKLVPYEELKREENGDVY